MPEIKWSVEKFIHDASEIHGHMYDYSKVFFRTCNDKVIIGCKIHGEFEQLVKKHIKSENPHGCPECGKIKKGLSRRSNLESFITRARIKHGDKYDYSKVEYKTNHSKVKIICPIAEHGVFEQAGSSHLSGRGCPKCYELLRGNSQRLTTEQFIEKAISIHGLLYDYSKVEYRRSHTKVIIICKIHGEFQQIPNAHLCGSGCHKCGSETNGKESRLSLDEFTQRAMKIHRGIYDYSKVQEIGGWDVKIPIICRKHDIFMQTIGSHLCGRGCPRCMNSTGESIIRNFLTDMNILFTEQKKFPTCRYIDLLRFDFHIPQYNLLVEYNGIQHYPEEAKKIYKNGTYISPSMTIRDEIKVQWCKDNNINLLVIRYDQDPIEKLKEFLKQSKN